MTKISLLVESLAHSTRAEQTLSRQREISTIKILKPENDLMVILLLNQDTTSYPQLTNNTHVKEFIL